MDILSTKTVITRKVHTCNGCDRSMPAGTQMSTSAITDDGRIYNWRHCPVCTKVYEMTYPGDEVMQGWLVDEMKEYEFEGTPEEYLAHLESWPDYPYPHTHTPLPGGGHVTSDRPLTLEAMEVVGKMVEHFYHKKI